MTPRCCPVCGSEDVRPLGPNDFQCSVCQAKIVYSTTQISISPPPAAAASGICPCCHTQNERNATFCLQCSTKLQWECPSCQEVIRTDARFCPHCRTPLERSALLQFVSNTLKGIGWEEFDAAANLVTKVDDPSRVPPRTAWLYAKASTYVMAGKSATRKCRMCIIVTASEVLFIEPGFFGNTLMATYRYADLERVVSYSFDTSVEITDEGGQYSFEAGSKEAQAALCLFFRYLKERP